MISIEAVRGAEILIVDDEPVNVRLLERMLQKDGYTRVRGTTSPDEGIALFEAREPDLLIVDLNMPGVSGSGVIERVRQRLSNDAYLPILLMTAEPDVAVLRQAVSAGATDYLTKPFEQLEAMLRIRNLLTARLLYRNLLEQNRAHG